MGKINIHYFTPFSLTKNLGEEYNKYVSLVKNDNDWICFTDADTMFMTDDYGKQIHEIVSQNQNVGLFTCYTNRVNNEHQCYMGTMNKNDSIINHRRIGLYLQEHKFLDLKFIEQDISGVMMLFQKKTWKQVGKFSEGTGLLGVDTYFSRKILKGGFKIAVMEGVYLLHYYRLLEGMKYKKHLE